MTVSTARRNRAGKLCNNNIKEPAAVRQAPFLSDFVSVFNTLSGF